MTLQQLKIAPEYLSFYVAGSRRVDIPLDMERRTIVANRDCINIPALYWNEGDTRVSIGTAQDNTRMDVPTYDGILRTPDNVVMLFDANTDSMASINVPGQETRVRVWINHPTEPDDVFIVLG